jgi:hypothetical protein
MRFAEAVFCLMLVLGLVPVAGSAQENKPLREPDVIFVPTPQAVVDAMLKMAGVHKGDVVYDLTRVQISCLTTFPTLRTLGITQL